MCLIRIKLIAAWLVLSCTRSCHPVHEICFLALCVCPLVPGTGCLFLLSSSGSWSMLPAYLYLSSGSWSMLPAYLYLSSGPWNRPLVPCNCPLVPGTCCRGYLYLSSSRWNMPPGYLYVSSSRWNMVLDSLCLSSGPWNMQFVPCMSSGPWNMLPGNFDENQLSRFL
jgi:hypothetical protein